MLPKKIKHYLDDHHVKYVTMTHSPAYTAQEIAASSHIPGRSMAKTVIIKVDGKLMMVVEPAYAKVDIEALKKLLGAKKVELASEYEFQDKFPDCELGAMPPIGEIYGMDVYASDRLLKDDIIAFNAGSHSELVKMSFKDFENLVHPKFIKC